MKYKNLTISFERGKKKYIFKPNVLAVNKFFKISEKDELNKILFKLEQAFDEAYRKGTAIWIIADDFEFKERKRRLKSK